MRCRAIDLAPRDDEPDPDVAWVREAACYGADTAMFFPERGASAEPAKALCRRCPVIAECREYALREAGGRYFGGVWGGLSARELTEMARERQLEADQRDHLRPLVAASA